VQQDVEYKVNVPIWSGLSNFHMLYLLKVMISWSNLKFPLYMALASSYAAAHIPNVKNLRLVNFQMMRALIADLLAPTSSTASTTSLMFAMSARIIWNL